MLDAVSANLIIKCNTLNGLIMPNSENSSGTESATSYYINKGTPHKTEVHVIIGEQEGPTTLITAGCHGDEVGGIKAAKRIAENKHNLSMNRGRLIIIPEAHKLACENGTRKGRVKGGKWHDLNEEMDSSKKPSELSYTPAQGIATVIHNNHPEYHLDLHTSLGLYSGFGSGGRPSPARSEYPNWLKNKKGQVAFAQSAGTLRRVLGVAADMINDKFSLGDYNGGYDYRMSLDKYGGVIPSVDGKDDMIADYSYATQGTESTLVEITEDAVPNVEQAAWHYWHYMYTLEELGYSILEGG